MLITITIIIIIIIIHSTGIHCCPCWSGSRGRGRPPPPRARPSRPRTRPGSRIRRPRAQLPCSRPLLPQAHLPPPACVPHQVRDCLQGNNHSYFLFIDIIINFDYLLINFAAVITVLINHNSLKRSLILICKLPKKCTEVVFYFSL